MAGMLILTHGKSGSQPYRSCHPYYCVGYDYGEFYVLSQHDAPTGFYIISPYIFERGIVLHTPTQGFLTQADNPSRLNTFGSANILIVKATPF